MSLASGALARRMRLPRAQSRTVVCERDLRVPMPDGAVLLADRWVGREGRGRSAPTVLVRSPYGRRQFVGLLFGRMLAERGLQVLVQSVRGTFGSDGRFSPFDERADGLATLRWLREQPWHSGPIGMIGPSYLGLVQWAVALDGGEDLAALSIQVSASQFHGQSYAGGSLSLESAASWLVLVAAQERRLAPLWMLRGLRGLPALLADGALGDLDERATGAEVAWFREALSSPAREDPYWVARDFASGVADVRARVQLIGGWNDIFLPWMLEDFAALAAAGRAPQLVIGPWTHTHPALTADGLREGIAWLRSALLGDSRMLSPAPVRIFVTGERAGGGWRELDSWPPPGVCEHGLCLGRSGTLCPQAGEDGSERYRYDPADPTPSLGGPVLLARDPVRDNAPLEQRPDVLTFTSEPLAEPAELIGTSRVQLHVRASSAHFDLFARVCDVDGEGVSRNVCDALLRLGPEAERDADGAVTARFALWPAAHRFAAGHRIRLQVSSGAHPRYARNSGTGEPQLTSTSLAPVDVELLFGERHPSAVWLPMLGRAPAWKASAPQAQTAAAPA